MGKKRVNWRSLLTPGGEPNAEYRKRWAILSNGRFPVAPGDVKRGLAAIRLRGRNTTKAERKRILIVVARRVPSLAKIARRALESDRRQGLI